MDPVFKGSWRLQEDAKGLELGTLQNELSSVLDSPTEFHGVSTKYGFYTAKYGAIEPNDRKKTTLRVRTGRIYAFGPFRTPG